MTPPTVVDGRDALALTAARHISAHVARAIRDRGHAVVCLTGGRTAERVYELLAEGGQPAIDWKRVHLFWGDERHVPPDHADSNFGMAQRTLLHRVAIPTNQVHAIRGELDDPGAAAREYEETLRREFHRMGRSGHTFDVMLLSVGSDAHIASIFPASELLVGRGLTPREAGRKDPPHVAAVWAAHLGRWRITLTPDALLDAAAILVLASGKSKADAVQAALELPDDVLRWPVQLLRVAGERVQWLIDRDAAGRL